MGYLIKFKPQSGTVAVRDVGEENRSDPHWRCSELQLWKPGTLWGWAVVMAAQQCESTERPKNRTLTHSSDGKFC